MDSIVLFSDESCYVENDGNDVMGLATIYTKENAVRIINKEIRKIKLRYNIDPNTELKWTKISNGNLAMYKEVIDYIYKTTAKNQTRIRTLVAKDKLSLDTVNHGITYDEWYHAMYYYLFRKIIADLSKNDEFVMFIDKKDSNTQKNVSTLATYLTRHFLFEKKIIARVADSKEHQLIQLADVFAGAACYKHRGLKSSKAKLEILRFIENKFQIDYKRSTKLEQVLFSNFVWSKKYVK